MPYDNIHRQQDDTSSRLIGLYGPFDAFVKLAYERKDELIHLHGLIDYPKQNVDHSALLRTFDTKSYTTEGNNMLSKSTVRSSTHSKSPVNTENVSPYNSSTTTKNSYHQSKKLTPNSSAIDKDLSKKSWNEKSNNITNTSKGNNENTGTEQQQELYNNGGNSSSKKRRRQPSPCFTPSLNNQRNDVKGTTTNNESSDEELMGVKKRDSKEGKYCGSSRNNDISVNKKSNHNTDDLQSPDSGFVSVNSDKHTSDGKDSSDDIETSETSTGIKEAKILELSKKVRAIFDCVGNVLPLLPKLKINSQPQLSSKFVNNTSTLNSNSTVKSIPVYKEPVIVEENVDFKCKLNISGLSADRKRHLKSFLTSEYPSKESKIVNENSSIKRSKKETIINGKRDKEIKNNIVTSSSQLNKDLHKVKNNKREFGDIIGLFKTTTPKNKSSPEESPVVPVKKEKRSSSNIATPNNSSRSSSISRIGMPTTSSSSPLTSSINKFKPKVAVELKQNDHPRTIRDYDFYGKLAKDYKHKADKTDREKHGMKKFFRYLECVVYFIAATAHQVIANEGTENSSQKIRPAEFMNESFKFLKDVSKNVLYNDSKFKSSSIYSRLSILVQYVKATMLFKCYDLKKKTVIANQHRLSTLQNEWIARNKTNNEQQQDTRPGSSSSYSNNDKSINGIRSMNKDSDYISPSTDNFNKTFTQNLNNQNTALSYLLYAHGIIDRINEEKTDIDEAMINHLDSICGRMDLHMKTLDLARYLLTGITWLRKEYEAEMDH
uniref:AF4/FMR2 family member lilli n=1 Tax=Parastrongyloides trichosuri TaxID=131310 RepID=A0A0N5A174_PARTI